MTLAEAQAALTKLDAAIINGHKTVEIGGRSLTFHDASDLTAYADRLRRDIAKASGKPSVITAAWSGSK